MIDAVKEILIDEETIRKTVNDLAKRINEDYKGKNLVLLIILKGSSVFASDLARKLNMDVTLEFMQVSSYGSGSVSSGEIKILKDAQIDLNGRDVLIAEDIIDSGNTLNALVKLLQKRGANVEICTLLSKPSRREVQVDVKYTGIEIPDEFVVGYGLDYAEKFRQLPYIGILKREVYTN
ncbi:MAG: hypoxanthine phosphoribosyltransferase [Oscillospiraceae bacterium]|nr:hypoxanthine phosphoribosyltransferase [Oscillospiraceae bacterium]